MTGEMSQFDADHGEEWALHRSIARAIGGKVRAFDVYQGPYISPPDNGIAGSSHADKAAKIRAAFPELERGK